MTAATGYVLLQASETDGARQALTAALNQPHPTPRHQRVLILIDLATAELSCGNFPDACSYATKVADLLHHVVYAVGGARLHMFRAAAQRPLPSGALRVLDAYLSEIAA